MESVGHYMNLRKFQILEHLSGPKLIPGMTLGIEPMVNLGGEGTKLCDDGWTVVTSDGAKSAHFENTVLITDSKPEVLTS